MTGASWKMYNNLKHMENTQNEKINTEANGIGCEGWPKSKYALMGWLGLDVGTIWCVSTLDVVRIQLGCKFNIYKHTLEKKHNIITNI